MKRIALALISILSILSARGIDRGPFFKRICLSNNGDSIVTLSWVKPADTCNSFKNYRIFGRESTVQLFQLLDSIDNLNTETVSIKLPNALLTWEFFIETRFLCDGTTPVNSDTLSIDRTRPPTSVLDSISVDFMTQKIIAGWRPNTAPDTKSYIFYEIVNSIPQIKSEVLNTNYLDNSTNPETGPKSFSIAASDSCDNLAPISFAHTSIHLTTTIDSCKREIILSWTPYIGWTSVGHYRIFANINGGGFQFLDSVQGTTLKFALNTYNPGDNFVFYVRGVNGNDPGTTSSSNLSSRFTKAEILPQFNYLSRVTVRNSSQMEIKWLVDVSADIASFRIMKSDDGISFNTLTVLNNNKTNPQVAIDNSVNTGDRPYHYKIEALNNCGNILGTSNTSNSIHLTVPNTSQDAFELKWNQYQSWDAGVDRYTIRRGGDIMNSSTWNILTTTNQATTTYNDIEILQAEIGPEGICYYVEAEENTGNQFGVRETSLSNIVCSSRQITAFLPNSFRPEGLNREFKAIGAFIDHKNSNMKIFNRWGELVFTTNDTSTGWDGRDSGGTVAQEGIYLYLINLKAMNGRNEILKGTFTLIK